MPADQIKIIEVTSKKAIREFVEFPYRQFSISPFWVGPPKRDVYHLLDRMKHPFHEHAEVAYFLAIREGKIVGRVAAIENFAHNTFHDEKIGFFGFLDAIEDNTVFDKLIKTAQVWCERRGLTALRGPCSFSTNEECGILIDGFEYVPSLMMPWTPRYYRDYFEQHQDFEKAEDLFCYWINTREFPHRLRRLADASEERLKKQGHKVNLRPLDKKNWNSEIELVKAMYNKAWEKNWGFIPLTDHEMDHIAKEMKLIVDPNLILFVEIDDQVAGFSLSIPDYNQILRFTKGRLGPKEIAMFGLLRKRIHRTRMLMMGILPEFRNRGLELLMYWRNFFQYENNGYSGGELSWILERNKVMNKALVAISGEPYRTYRLYEKPLKK